MQRRTECRRNRGSGPSRGKRWPGRIIEEEGTEGNATVKKAPSPKLQAPEKLQLSISNINELSPRTWHCRRLFTPFGANRALRRKSDHASRITHHTPPRRSNGLDQ